MMHLLRDDHNQVYIWVDDTDENVELSPHYDYEEDAIIWYGTVAKEMFQDFGVR